MARIQSGLRKRTWFAIFLLLGVALLLRLTVRQGRVQGPSMEPTYYSGETVLVWKTAPRSQLLPGNIIRYSVK